MEGSSYFVLLSHSSISRMKKFLESKRNSIEGMKNFNEPEDSQRVTCCPKYHFAEQVEGSSAQGRLYPRHLSRRLPPLSVITVAPAILCLRVSETIRFLR
jgi:hypothetical protein